MIIIDLLKALLYGIVEGITEWLPISSTGHIILLQEILSLEPGHHLHPSFAAEFEEMFQVVIQLGAILAVIVLYFRKLNPFAPSKSALEKKQTWTLWFKVVVASIPAGIVGTAGDMILEAVTGKDIDGWCYQWYTVVVTLIVYGIAFILVEKFYKPSVLATTDVHDISYRQAFKIGIFQTLALVPGTSRSGATILGGRLFSVERSAAAEFCFFMGIPVMIGAGGIKMLGFLKFIFENDISVTWDVWAVLLLACASAFVVSMVAIRFLMNFVKKRSFAPFGVYRIVLGVLVLGFFLIFR